MPYRKDGNDIIEYEVIPSSERILKRMSLEQFTAMKNDLETKVSQDPKTVGDKILATIQTKLDEVNSAQVEMDKI